MKTFFSQDPPVLDGRLLRLRPLEEQDAPTVAELGGAREIADTTISVPHPFGLEQARGWIQRTREDWRSGRGVALAMVQAQEGGLVGVIVLRDLDWEHLQGEVSFWVGRPYWGRGYAEEALRLLLPLAFRQLGLNRLYAPHMVRNPASGRVLEKVGFRREGLMRQRVRKWGVFEDVVLLALLREEWAAGL